MRRYNINQAGFVMVLMMIFMPLLLSAVIDESLKISFLLRLVKVDKNNDQHRDDLMSELSMIEDDLSHGMVQCRVNVQPADLLLSYPLSWWQQNACHHHGKQIDYFSIIELLSVDACGTSYYRVTLKGVASIADKMMMQSLLAVPVVPYNGCTGQLHQVHPKRQMLRVLLG